MNDDAYSMESFVVNYNLEGLVGDVRFYWRFVDGEMVSKCDNGVLSKAALIRVMTALVNNCELTGEVNTRK